MEKKWIVEQVMDVYTACTGNVIDEADKMNVMVKKISLLIQL